jgi:dienelactone hydrolase
MPNNHRGVTFIANHLASRGMIVVSVDMSQVDDIGTNINERTLLFLAAVDYLVAQNAVAGSPFNAQLDLSRVVFSGHSRGGETAIRAAQQNRARPAATRRNVRAVFAFSPTDFLSIPHGPEPLLLLYATRDGDLSTGPAFPIYDRATAPKKLVLIYGGNHFCFTDTASLSFDVPAIARAAQQTVAQGYAAAFLGLHILGQAGQVFTLSNHRGIGAIGGLRYFGLYDDPTIRLVDDFEPLGALTPNDLGGAVTITAGTASRVSLPLTTPSLVPHATPALDYRHGAGAPAPEAEEELPAGTSYCVHSHLSLKALQLRDDPLNPVGIDQDFSLELEDAAGQKARLNAGSDFAIPYPDGVSGFPSMAIAKSVFASIRIPLGRFVAANNGLNLCELRRLRVILDRTSTSALVIDDIKFTL